MPTSIFTNHTGFPKFSKLDCTDWTGNYITDWKAIGLGFEAIQTGFLASQAQMDFVLDFVDAFHAPHTLVAVDPVMPEGASSLASALVKPITAAFAAE